jgi:aryl-alcohol dehydrogenase-like predicted oxidoreductase
VHWERQVADSRQNQLTPTDCQARLGVRDNIVVSTKCGFPTGGGPNDGGLSRKHLFSAIDASLRRLDMDYVDIYVVQRWDYDTPIEETIRALADILRTGKARYVGASRMFAWQFMSALSLQDRIGAPRFVVMQSLCNLLYREEERDMFALCKSEGIAVMPWSPLACGRLARPFESRHATLRARTDSVAWEMYDAQKDDPVHQRCTAVARSRAISPARVAVAWLLQKDVVACPIVGATQVGHVTDAAKALDVSLTRDEIQVLEDHYQPHPVIGHA